MNTRERVTGTDDGVAVIILTYKRPELLQRCVISAMRNEVRPLEIVVSDDAISDESRAAVASIDLPEGITVRHIKGPSVGSQAANAQAALEAATCENVILMHDDDYLLDGAIDHLLAVREKFSSHADAVYGLQQHVNFEGEIDWKQTLTKNEFYRKNVPEGVQDSNLWCALTGQFPNNGMLIRRSVALAAGYPKEAEVGRIPVDYHFALRYAQTAMGPFVLTSQYTSAYTLEGPSIWRQSHLVRKYNGHLGYHVLLKVKACTEPERQALGIAKDRFAASAVMGHLSAGESAKAWAIYRAHWRRMDKPWSLRMALGMRVLTQLLLPPWKQSKQAAQHTSAQGSSH